MDHENVRLWTRQVEDVFNSMGIKQQLEQFITLTTLLNEEEATVIQDLTMAEPRPDNVFDQARKNLFLQGTIGRFTNAYQEH